MPPYQADTDSSYQDDWNRLFNDEKLSPLFRDHDSKIAPSSSSCRLDKRQSDPEYAAAAEGGRERTTSSEDPLGHRPSTTSTTSTTTATAAAVVSTRVSRITSIIGPESAYVKSGDSAPGDVGGLTPPSPPPPPPLPDADEPSAPEPEATPPARPSEMMAPSDDLGKLETRSLLVRVTRFVSKRGWKRKVSSAFGTSKNVV